MLEDIPPELVSHDRGLGAPETGRNKDRVGVNTAVDQRYRPGYGEFQIGAPDFKAECIKVPYNILERDVREEDLAIDGFCCTVYLLLHARVVRPQESWAMRTGAVMVLPPDRSGTV